MSTPYDLIAPYYDLVTDGGEWDVAMYTGFASRLDLPVLEVGVGTGRVALALAQRGYSVWGIDSSPAMLAVARAKASATGVLVELREADARCIRLERRFGLVFCAADSFLHLADADSQLAALRSMRRHLAPDGRIVLDLPAPAGTWADWQPGMRPLELVWSGRDATGAPVQHFSTFTVDASTQTRCVTHLFDTVDRSGAVRRTMITFDLRFVFPAEARLLVRAAGLAIDDVYGGYELQPFTMESERMIVVARRQQGNA